MTMKEMEMAKLLAAAVQLLVPHLVPPARPRD